MFNSAQLITAAGNALSVGGALAVCLVLLPLTGWWLAANSRADFLERVTAASLAGAAFLAGAEILVNATHLPQWIAIALVAAAIFASARKLRVTFRSGTFDFSPWLTWGAASAILVAATLPYAVHGLFASYWDWYEHWLRALIFETRGPIDTPIGSHYSMASRGPLFNAACAFLMALFRTRQYWVFQIIATALNALVVLPAALIVRAVSGLTKRSSLMAAAMIVVVVPFFFWNNTFTWTKDLTAAFVLTGTYQYLMAYRESDAPAMARSLLWFAVGFLCHFLALLYGVLLLAHLIFSERRKLPLRELFRTGVIATLIVGPWFAWMALQFGVQGTMNANTTTGNYYAARDQQGRLVPLPRIWLANLCTDFLPVVGVCRPMFPADVQTDCKSLTVAGDTAATTAGPCPTLFDRKGIYALAGYTGTVALLVAATLLGSARLPDARFLLWFIVGGLVINSLPVRWFDARGNFNESMHAWSIVLFAVAVRCIRQLPRPLIVALLLAMFGEFAVIDIQTIRAQSIVLPLPEHSSALRGDPPLGELLPRPGFSGHYTTDYDYYNNYRLKISGGAVYFRDLHPDTFGLVAWLMFASGAVAFAFVLGGANRQARTGGQNT